MNVADEATGAHLKASVHSCSNVSQMDRATIVKGLNKCFERWGKPQNIKIDNGPPLVVPKHLDVPTLATLWWTGLGINVIQNTVRRPQENGIVECLQGTLHSWANPKGQQSIESLQKRLDKESEFQREQYRLPKKGHKTRIELFPELETNLNQYNPDDFDIDRVYRYLGKKVWYRKIRKGGVVSFWGDDIFIGRDLAREEVYITFDPIDIEWIIRKKDGTILKTSKKKIPTEKLIKEFALEIEDTT